MIKLKVTQQFKDYIANACSLYKQGWSHVQKFGLLDNEHFLRLIEENDMKPARCYAANVIGGVTFEGCPDSLSKWKNVLSAVKKLSSMQESQTDGPCEQSDKTDKQLNQNIAQEVPELKKHSGKRQTEKISSDDNSSEIAELREKVAALENELSKYIFALNELRDIVSNMQNYHHTDESVETDDFDDFMETLGFSENKHSEDELEAMRNASMQDFEHMVRYGTPESRASSKGIVETHVIHNAANSMTKGNDISADLETTTSVVYDTENPCATRREVELREAKQAVANIRKEKGALNEHPDSDDERKRRWLDAVHKSRIQRGLGVDIGVLQKDGFNCDDPNNSIFTQG